MSDTKRAMIRKIKRSNQYKKEDNNSVAKKLVASAGHHDCKICPPWKGENKVARVPKRGTKKPKYKIKRAY